MAQGNCHHNLLDWRGRDEKQSGAKPRELLGRQVGGKFWRHGYSRPHGAREFHPGEFYSTPESVLYRASLQRCAERRPQTGSLRRYSMVQGGVQRLSLIHISEPTRLLSISYAVFCLK